MKYRSSLKFGPSKLSSNGLNHDTMMSPGKLLFFVPKFFTPNVFGPLNVNPPFRYGSFTFVTQSVYPTPPLGDVGADGSFTNPPGKSLNTGLLFASMCRPRMIMMLVVCPGCSLL